MVQSAVLSGTIPIQPFSLQLGKKLSTSTPSGLPALRQVRQRWNGDPRWKRRGTYVHLSCNYSLYVRLELPMVPISE